IGALTGVFAISLGIGGGLILVPLLSLYLHINSKQAIPISLFFIIFASVSGFASLAYHGYVQYVQGATVGVASLVGVSIGIALLRVIDAKKHRYALVALYALVIAAMIQKLLES
ncbi:MAG: sulfite exporter TauE/SafE family protein, partial [Helicobacter sp.]|nr:sulfite exporter TauE/SafE family protein [Helicobacter sp.]